METVAAQTPTEEPKPARLRASGAARPRLRVALVADSARQPRWAADAFAKLEGSDFAELVAVVETSGARNSAPWPWEAYCRLDKWAFGLELDPLERVALKAQLSHCPHFSVHAQGVEWRPLLRSLDADVLFLLGEVCANGLDGIARYGLWRFCFGSGAEHDSLAGIREIALGAPVMPSGIKAALSVGQPERLLYQSWSRCFTYSLARTLDNLLPRAADFVPRALKLLHEGGEAWIRGCASIPPSSPWPERQRIRPEEFVKLASILGYRVARAVQQRAYVQQWFIAYCFGRNESWQGDFGNFTWMLPPKDRFWADPFPLEREGEQWIFFEELMFARDKAHISAVQVGLNGARSEPVKVLERAYHLSYPFLIRHSGELYMIPETGANRSVEIYRCKRFPDEWTLEAELLRGGFYTDATVHRIGNRWWLFANLSAPGTQGSDELNLFYADDLFGPWKPHRRNPVKSDVRGARPAGCLYERDGRLYRPGQIGAPIYGWGISINEVTRLTPEEYAEVEVQRVVPCHPKEILGVHTLNRSGELMVVDGFTRRPRMWN